MQIVENILASGVLLTTPILFAAIGGLFNRLGGIVNIGLEGKMLLGAIVALLVSANTNSWFLGILAAAFASSLAGVLLGFPLLIGALLLHWPIRGYRLKTVFLVLTGTMVFFTGLAFWKVMPQVASFHSSKSLVVGIRERLSSTQPLIFYRFFHHTANYYSDYKVLSESIDDLENLNTYLSQHPQEIYLILTQKDGFRELTGQLDVQRVQAEGNQFLLEVRFSRNK